MNASITSTIQVQDQYIATVSKIAPSRRNYYSHVSRAESKAITAIMGFGLTLPQAHDMVRQAHDVACLMREVTA